jgi:hypothetical protein
MRTRIVGMIAALAISVGFVGCIGAKIEPLDAPIDPATSLIGSTIQKRSLSDYEAYGFTGSDKHVILMSDAPIRRGDVFYHAISPGKKRIYVRVLATAHAGLPGLLDDVTFVDATIEGGKAYDITGSRSGEILTVWLEESRSKIRVSDTNVIAPRRRAAPVLLPIK